MSEVHKHEQAAVSPSFILNLTETTQELGTSCLVFVLVSFSLFACCVSLFLCVCCVWREKEESDVCTWELWKHSFWICS